MFNTRYYCSAVVGDILKVQKRGKSFVLHVVKGYSAFCQRKLQAGSSHKQLTVCFQFHLPPSSPPSLPRDDSQTVQSEGQGG